MSDYEIVQAMAHFGGTFSKALAAAWQVADEGNRARIKKAWPDYWDEYRELAELKQKQVAEASR